MEFLDIFLLGVGFFTFYVAAKRLDTVNAAESFKYKFEGVEAKGIREESVSFNLRNDPLFLSPWKRGRFTSLNERPILFLISFILMIAVVFQIIVLAMTYTKFAVLIGYVVIAFAFHNGPDDINIDEYYLRKITKKDPNTHNGHDVLLIRNAASNFKSWSLIQGVFGLSFVLSVFLPIGLVFIVFLMLILFGFLYLGYKYSADRAIFR